MDTVIWVISENATLREKLPALLQALGYASRLFKLPKSALHTLGREEPPALILLDEKALDFLSRLRENPRFVHLPVVVITPAANEVALERVLHLGGDGVLGKPITPDVLQKVIAEALKRRRAMAG
jgi:CheY-like chemotaxis protein